MTNDPTDVDADVHTLSGAYAIGAVDASDGALFEGHLSRCADCREEVRSLREALVRLAESSAVEPPAQLKQAVMAQVARTPQAAAPRVPHAPVPHAPVPHAPVPRATVPQVPAPRLSGGARVRGSWLVAAAFAVLAALGGTLAWSERHSADQARQVAATAQEAASSAQREASKAQQEAGSARTAASAAERLAAVLGDPAARRVAGTATGGGDVQLVVAQGSAVVVTSQLPGLGDGSVYQLWIVAPGGVSSAGLGPAGPQAAGHWTRLVTGVRGGDTVAISVEPSGGSRQPTTVPIVALKA